MIIMINPLRSKEDYDDADISIENFHRAVDSRELWIADAGVHVRAFLGGGKILGRQVFLRENFP